MLLIAISASKALAASNPPDLTAGERKSGTILTIWPLLDYRSSPATGYSNLGILGPLFKREHNGSTSKTAIRPLFFNTSSERGEETDILYPIASASSSSDASDIQILRLFRKQISRSGTKDENSDTMLFPFYIKGRSEKYGDYTSVFPFYGDIYERFWRDEYHYTLFPLYGRTVKKGTTSTNWLYPIFNSTTGEHERGFHVWPLYGHASKTGVYEKSFMLWPFYIAEKTGLNTDNPTDSLYLLPFYASSRSPERTATYAPWPFCGTVRDGSGQILDRYYLWPFWMTSRGKDAETERYLPFYSIARVKDSTTRWIMWPIYRRKQIESPSFTQDKTSLLFFLFNHSEETWPKAGKSRGSSSFWPLYAWNRDEKGVSSFSFPALTEAVIRNDGVERNWAPLWRIFISKWDQNGNGVTSVLWNLFWSEKRGQEKAWEIFPLASYRSTRAGTDLLIFKGIFGYSDTGGKISLSLFWIPLTGWNP